MDGAAIASMVERAVVLRGTVMLSVRGDQRRWCAASAAVDGSLQLSVGEPSRGWRRWRPSPGEEWLREHGFVHVLDAWAAPMARGATPRACAELLDAALREGLGARADAELVEVPVHPGVIDEVPPPAREAPHVEHVRAALTALAVRARGKACFSGGRPAETWAWAFVVGDELELSPEPLERTAADYPPHDWHVSLAQAAPVADDLTAFLHGELGRDPDAPLFIDLMDV